MIAVEEQWSEQLGTLSIKDFENVNKKQKTSNEPQLATAPSSSRIDPRLANLEILGNPEGINPRLARFLPRNSVCYRKNCGSTGDETEDLTATSGFPYISASAVDLSRITYKISTFKNDEIESIVTRPPFQVCAKVRPKRQIAKTIEKKATGNQEHFMKLALITAQRSKDPCTQVGCVIVDEHDKLVSVGYNGFPRGVDDDEFRWDKSDPEDNKHLYVVHAETNAIMNKRRNTLHGCTLYVTLLPCNECAKLIIQSRVAKIVYMEERDSTCYEASRKMLRAAKIPFEKCQMPTGTMEFDV